MGTTTLRLYSLTSNQAKTYLAAALFVAANIIQPQLCHLIPGGGRMLLPIYFFTLLGAYKYGWRVGLLTALLSAPVNCLLFGMPAPAALPVIMVKSLLLAGAASYAAARSQRASILTIAAVVLFYQISGSLFEWLWTGSFIAATADFTGGLPGMVLQAAGVWLLLNSIMKR